MKMDANAKKTVRILAMLKISLLVLFVGWLFIWVLLPTKTYKSVWVLKLNKKLNTTFIGAQGTNMVLFAIPVMLIAVLGCVYLHFENKRGKSFSKSDRQFLNSWRRPLIVMNPLGITTVMELVFAAMFAALMIWSLANYINISFGALHMHNAKETVAIARFRSIALRVSYIGHVSWAFLFFPVTRGSSILPLLGLTSESSIKYHIWLGHFSMVMFMAHSIGFVIYYALTDQWSEMIAWSRTYVPNVAGEIATVIAAIMWATCIPRVRRKMFEVFFYTHQLYPLYFFFYALHVGVAYTVMILPGVFLFVIDRFLRFLQSKKSAQLLAARILPCDSLELIFSKTLDLTYNPTSILFVNVPSISKLQWHPFTVISNSNLEPERLSIAIKCLGSWTQKLYQQLSSSSVNQLQVSVEGPYGPTSSHFQSWESLVMVSGGSGVTPFISIIRELIFQSTQPNTQVPKAVLVCSFKNYADLAMLDLILPVSGIQADLSRLDLRIEAYITRETEQKSGKNLIQTVSFKPNPSDSPITPSLGPNSWLWLGAIIASSFVMFLLLLGIITRYYIYPMDHNTNVVYHYSFWTIWDMFLACLCILVAASGIFLWQKRSMGGEGKLMQVQNVDVPTPTTSPGSWMHTTSVDAELESLPHQSLVQATNVHFGEKPNLKKILFDYQGSDVGVLVCGPKKMRHEVAKICASGLADNLHFEAISFNW